MVYLPSGVRTAAGFYLAHRDAGAPLPVDVLAAPEGTGTLGNFGGRILDPFPASLRLLSRRTVWLLSYTDSARHAGPTATAVLDGLMSNPGRSRQVRRRTADLSDVTRHWPGSCRRTALLSAMSLLTVTSVNPR